ncbi:MAG TPA: cytochrome c3 family protein [Catalimonadaceae bacterium]|mgnify:FL=1|nr:cytochrome c3 family protein [Catalimonadaceae bacterium]
MNQRLTSQIVKFSFSFLFCLGLLTPRFSHADSTAVAAAGAPAPAAAAAGGGDAVGGEAVFKANCKQCHAINDVVVGPALKDAHKRWPSKEKLAGFIKYPQKVIEGGNAYAKGLYDKYKQFMPNHDFLSDKDIDNVIAYVVKESENPTVAKDDKKIGPDTPEKGGDEGSGLLAPVIAILLVTLLVVIILLLVVINLVSKILSQKKEELNPDDIDQMDGSINWGTMFGHPLFKGVVAFIFVVMIGKVVFDQFYAIGIQQGYAPDQPIAFSHKLHAGMYEIDCNYCHTGVNKGKSATIPAANICMNCHNVIKTESPQIKKIWNAVENNQPIKWVRIHNLPDLAYFNHAQHVKVGGIECEKCHGPIKEMEVVQQHSPLTMGWCINCHRETVVKTEGNAYYDKMVEIHQANHGTNKLKVEDIGGLECSKCHY